MSRTGDVHHLPSEDRPDADLKRGRPWLLLHDPSETAPSWVFAYGSSQATEAVLGATPLALGWTRTSRDGPRPEATNFFPARIQGVAPDAKGTLCGSARRHRAQIHTAFRSALGIGEPPMAGAAHNSVGRGRIVRLSEISRLLLEGASYAIVVTPSAYAHLRRYQHLVPIYDACAVLPEEGDLEIDAAWMQRLPHPITRGFLAVPMLFTGTEDRRPFDPGQIAALTSVVVDQATLHHVDEALIAAFGL